MTAASDFRSRVLALYPSFFVVADYSITMDGANRISDWISQAVAAGTWTQADAARKPLFVAGTNPLLRFDGDTRYDFLAGPVIPLGANVPHTMSILVKSGVPVNPKYYGIFTNGVYFTNDVCLQTDYLGRNYWRYPVGGGTYNYAVEPAGTIDGNTRHIVARYDGTNMRARVRGADVTPAAWVAGIAPGTRSVIGGNVITGANNFANMDLFYIAMFNRALSEADMELLRVAVSERYGLEVHGKVRIADGGGTNRIVVDNLDNITLSGATLNSIQGDVTIGVPETRGTEILRVSNGAVLFEGTTGTVPVAGAGPRFMWSPAKKAIRAGETTLSAWDDAKVGTGSAAFGIDNASIGSYSVLANKNNYAAGNFNSAFGVNGVARLNSQLVFGQGAFSDNAFVAQAAFVRLMGTATDAGPVELTLTNAAPSASTRYTLSVQSTDCIISATARCTSGADAGTSASWTMFCGIEQYAGTTRLIGVPWNLLDNGTLSNAVFTPKGATLDDAGLLTMTLVPTADSPNGSFVFTFTGHSGGGNPNTWHVGISISACDIHSRYNTAASPGSSSFLHSVRTLLSAGTVSAFWGSDWGVTYDSSNRVSALRDMMQGGYHVLQATSSRQPLYVPGLLPYIEFDGTRSLIGPVVPLAGGATFSIFAIFEQTQAANSTGKYIFALGSGGTNGTNILFWTTAGGVAYADYNVYTPRGEATSAIVAGIMHVDSRYVGGNLYGRTNAGAWSAAGGGTLVAPTTVTYIGAGAGGVPTNAMVGNLYCVGVRSPSFSDGELTALSTATNARYGVA